MPLVVQVIPRLNSNGGTERGVVDIARGLKAAGWGSVVVSAGGPLVTNLERHKIQHITLPVDSKNPIIIQANIFRLTKVIRQLNADIIHVRSRAPAWSVRTAAKRTNIPFLTTVQGIYNSSTMLKRRYNSIMTSGDLVITNSNFTAKHIMNVYGADPARIRIVHRGVDLSIFNPSAVTSARMVNLAERWRLPDGVSVVMLPGRLTRWKGHELLINAIAKIDRSDICCVFVGENTDHVSYQKTLENKINELKLNTTIRLVGGADDMPAAYMLADVVVNTSIRPEAFGRVLAEAESMGRPVVAADHGGAKETVISGKTGWLFKPGDVNSLTDALNQALNLSNESRDILAKNSMFHIKQNFSLEKMIESTINVYKELLED
tara:strand:+ start:508 stop:1638 length:1131 start_codon:yes stop_codon:yes gene_type:complete